MTRRVFVLFATSTWVVLAACGMARQAGGQQPSEGDRVGDNAKAVAAEITGIAVGEKAPPFKLKDQAGQERSLEEWLHDGSVAVVFYRSASW